MSINIEKAEQYVRCRSCGSDNNVIYISVVTELVNVSQGTKLALCKSCVKGLMRLLDNKCFDRRIGRRAIDANALKAYFFRPYSNEESYSNVELEKIIDSQLTIEPEQRTGRWVLKKKLVPLARDTMPLDYEDYDEATHSEWKEYYYCSECNYESGEFTGGKFCTNCGAKMNTEGMIEVSVSVELPNGRCYDCKYSKWVGADKPYMFLGCYHDPYHGKRTIEIEHCPREEAEG